MKVQEGIFLIFNVAVVLSLSTAVQSQAVLCGTSCALHTLQFNDEFNGLGVNGAAWNYRLDKGTPPRLSIQLQDNIAVGNGNMQILLKKRSVSGYNYTGGGLVSKRSFQYGYFEANMSLNDGAGWHSAFWLNAGNGMLLIAATELRTEIDIFEVDSIQPTQTRHNIIEWQGGGTVGTLTTGVYTSRFDFRGWHIWGLLWTEEGVNVWIDGALAWTQSYEPETWQHNYLNIWLSAIAYGNAPDDSKLPSMVRIDYVRYYQRDFYLTAGSLCDRQSQGTSCPSNAGYSESGVWSDSSLTGYTKGLLTRFSQCGTAGLTASWKITIPITGKYQISAFIIVHENSDSQAGYDVLRNGIPVQTRTFVNQASGVDRWQGLVQEVAINAGEQWMVNVASSGNGCTRADSVKFVRVA